MACGQQMWLHARNNTNACPHPEVAHCTECRGELCSAHIVECETCNHFVCSDCAPEHYRNHRRKETALRRRN